MFQEGTLCGVLSGVDVSRALSRCSVFFDTIRQSYGKLPLFTVPSDSIVTSPPLMDPGPYTTPAQVRQVNPSIQEDDDLTLPIISAHILVWNGIVANGCGAHYSEAQLALIEAWLAAHFHQVQTGIITSESAGGASQSFSIIQEAYLMNTLFGQQAMLLDTNGCLATLMAEIDEAKQGKKRKRVALTWLGSCPRRR